VAGQQGGRIVAGGALTGSFTGQINNVSMIANGSVAGNSAIAVTPTLASVQTAQVTTAPSGGWNGQINLVTGQAVDANTLVAPAAFPSTLAALTSALSRQLSGFSAKFTAAPASSPYPYETRFQYTDLGTFYGSDYFLSRMGKQSASLPKRLGDAYLDTQLVDQAVIAQTGQRFLSSSYTSESQ
jgi:hypothetical protein